MKPRCLELDLGLCVSSEWVDGALKVGVDLLGVEGSGRQLEPLQPLGLYARPDDPDAVGGVATNGSGALFGFLGDDGFVMPTTDPRTIGKVPQVKKGGTVLYNGRGCFLHMDGETGATMLYVPYANGTKAMVVSIDVSPGGQENIQIRHGDGHGVSLLGSGEVAINNRAGDAGIVIDDSGITLNGNVKLVGGLVAGNVAAAEPVMLSTQLLAWIGQANAAFAAIAAAAGQPTNPTVTAPVAAPVASTVVSASVAG